MAIAGNTPRLNLSLNYNPILRVYARTPDQNSIGQQLLGVADYIVVPDTFFVKASAFADEVPTNGGFTGLNFGSPTLGNQGFSGGAQSLNKGNLTQNREHAAFSLRAASLR